MSEHTQMTHAEASLRLVDYTAHELADAEHLAVEQHVMQCEECQQTMAEIQQLRSLLGLLIMPPQANAIMRENIDISIQPSTLADTVMARLSTQDTRIDEELTSTFVSDACSRPLSGIQGVIDAELQVNPLARNNGNAAMSMRPRGLPEATQQERSGPVRMKNALSMHPQKGWQRHLSILAATLFLALVVGSMAVILAMAAHNRGGAPGSPSSGGPHPVCTPTPQPGTTPTPTPTTQPGATPPPTPTPISSNSPTSSSAQSRSHCITPIPTPGPITPTPAPSPTSMPSPTPTPRPITPTPIPNHTPTPSPIPPTPAPTPTLPPTPTPAPTPTP